MKQNLPQFFSRGDVTYSSTFITSSNTLREESTLSKKEELVDDSKVCVVSTTDSKDSCEFIGNS